MWPFNRREHRGSIENPGIPLSTQNISAFFGWLGQPSAAGVTVNANRAMEVPAVWAAVNFIANSIAGLPLQVYERKDDTRQRIKDPLAVLLHDAPNDELTSFQWRKHLMNNVLLNGRAYTFIERNKAGAVMNLFPFDPIAVSVRRVDGRLEYKYSPSGQAAKTYSAHDIIDIPFALKSDGISHRDPVLTLRDAIGLTIALEEFASRFFQNGGVPPLVLEGPIQTQAGAKRASDDITRTLADSMKDQRNVLVMPSGHTLKAIGVDPEKSQMTEARRFQIEEIARLYSLPPVFLQDLTHGTFSNSEQQDLHFVKHTLKAWIEAIEQELNLKLFGAGAAKFAEFNIDGLVRGDFKTRMEGYGLAIQNGLRTPNEIRGENNWPAKPKGDDLMIQGATVPLGSQVVAPPQKRDMNDE